VSPEFVGGGLFAYLGAGTEGLRCKLCWNPGLKGEEWLLKAAFQAENSFHRPSEMVASANAYRLRILEVRG